MAICMTIKVHILGQTEGAGTVGSVKLPLKGVTSLKIGLNNENTQNTKQDCPKFHFYRFNFGRFYTFS